MIINFNSESEVGNFLMIRSPFVSRRRHYRWVDSSSNFPTLFLNSAGLKDMMVLHYSLLETQVVILHLYDS